MYSGVILQRIFFHIEYIHGHRHRCYIMFSQAMRLGILYLKVGWSSEEATSTDLCSLMTWVRVPSASGEWPSCLGGGDVERLMAHFRGESTE